MPGRTGHPNIEYYACSFVPFIRGPGLVLLNADDRAIAIPRICLPVDDRKQFLRVLPYTPVWMRTILRKFAQSEQT
jgi:hypothetical protein